MVQFSIRLEKEDCKDLEEYARSKRLPRAVCARMLIQERLSEIKEEKRRSKNQANKQWLTKHEVKG